MKDITIKSSTLKKESLFLALLFGLAMVINIVSILIYDGFWTELITQIPVVIVLTVVLYILVLLVRLLIYTIKKATGRTQ